MEKCIRDTFTERYTLEEIEQCLFTVPFDINEVEILKMKL